ncbi:UDP-glycosyltransferase 73C10-like [Corylus avellana]|uniref:UDP-glycosyltransferase 73C10-like n=1 Tax=Corylus avellana TaxID=13451 RepID=UPI00286C589D|nr:UDP-glycosyltransferase 73C10-like [Corylus avellana]
MASDQQSHQLHFILFPLMAQGHLIPMIDMAKMLAQQGMTVTVVIISHNAALLEKSMPLSIESGLHIRVILLQLPCQAAGIPEECDTIDDLLSNGLSPTFFTSTSMLQQQVEKLFEELSPPPSCILSDLCLPWTANVACKFHIPRFSFLTVSCFCLLCLHNLRIHSKVVESMTSSESDYFVLPGLPGHHLFTKSQLAFSSDPDPAMKKFNEEMVAADLASYGAIVNTFRELEPEYIKEYSRTRKGKVWCVGPVSLCNKDNLWKAERGNKASIEEYECLKWLDSQQPCSVVYACFGSLCNQTPSQLIELGLGLEESKKPFIWVIREAKISVVLEKWILENGFEERVKGRGLLIRGWAPQLLILSHPSVGGFFTHCGWNSTIEAISSGVPMLTWPLFGDQFINEKLVVQVLKIGVRVGVEDPVNWGEEEEKNGALVERENVKEAIDMLMDEGEEGEEMRKRARELGEMAKRAVEDGGSSHIDMTLLIQDIMQQAGCGKSA